MTIPNLDKNSVILSARVNSPKSVPGRDRPDVKYAVPAVTGEEQETGVVTGVASNEAVRRSGADMV